MKCDFCHNTANNPQWIWLIDVDSKGCKTVVKGASVACQGPDCAGMVLAAMDDICDKNRKAGRRWMLMDCPATERNRSRLMQNYDWSSNGVDHPKL